MKLVRNVNVPVFLFFAVAFSGCKVTPHILGQPPGQASSQDTAGATGSGGVPAGGATGSGAVTGAVTLPEGAEIEPGVVTPPARPATVYTGAGG